MDDPIFHDRDGNISGVNGHESVELDHADGLWPWDDLVLAGYWNATPRAITTRRF